jgi:hypothetical protein
VCHFTDIEAAEKSTSFHDVEGKSEQSTIKEEDFKNFTIKADLSCYPIQSI